MKGLTNYTIELLLSALNKYDSNYDEIEASQLSLDLLGVYNADGTVTYNRAKARGIVIDYIQNEDLTGFN